MPAAHPCGPACRFDGRSRDALGSSWETSRSLKRAQGPGCVAYGSDAGDGPSLLFGHYLGP